MTNRNGSKVKKLLKIIGGLLAIVLLAVIGYVAYVFLSYDRIEDRQALEINQPKASKKDFQSDFVNTGKTYTVGTYNVGFGAYLPDYSFFMDGGEYSRCYSGESGIGASYSGIAMYSKYEIRESLRRSLPISTGFSKFLDLDRCYSINRVKVDNGKELVLFLVHLSAYGNSDEIRQGQLNMLFQDMEEELQKGNYIICGGDFNHNLKADAGVRKKQ